MGSDDCSQLRIRLTDETLVAFRKIVEQSSAEVPESVKAGLRDENKFIGVDELRWLHSKAKDKGFHVHELLFKSEVVLPEPVVAPRNPELEARLERLKKENENREYNAMTKNVDNVRVRYPEDSIGYQIRQMNRQLIAVVQFVFSVGAGFLFGFHGLELLVGELEFGFRLLLGVICALIIALAEIYFLAKKLAQEYEVPPSRPAHSDSQSSASKPHQD